MAGGHHRVLKLACTIADLAGSDDIQSVHLAEALNIALKSFRRLMYRHFGCRYGR
jgi:predicted ATPase with chaperone activity